MIFGQNFGKSATVFSCKQHTLLACPAFALVHLCIESVYLHTSAYLALIFFSKHLTWKNWKDSRFELLIMFFYRPWAGSGDNFKQSVNSGPDFYTGQFDQHRWGFAALMLLTLLACIVLNGAVLGSFMFDWKNLKKMPHTLILTLCIRDLMVALILIPICIDW